jgi:endoglucanase
MFFLYRRKITIIAVVFFVVAGAVFSIMSRAATSSLSLESENGTVKGSAASVTDTGASASKAVRFGATTPTITPPPVVRGFHSAALQDMNALMLHDMKYVWNANIIRLKTDPAYMAKQAGKPLSAAWPEILDKLDKTVAAANADGIVVVVEMHHAPIDGGLTEDQERSSVLWDNPNLDSSFIDAWTRIATKLKPRGSGVWGYDLFNEPHLRPDNVNPPPKWRPLAAKLEQTIHKINSDAWVVYDPGPTGLPEGYINLTPLASNRVIYTFHDYDPHSFTHQGLPVPSTTVPSNIHYPYIAKGTTVDLASRRKRLQPIRDFQLKYKVPIYVGEFSVIRTAPKADAVLWLQDAVSIYESYGWSWTYHAFRENNLWSLEYDENAASTKPVTYKTDRAKVILQALSKNAK